MCHFLLISTSGFKSEASFNEKISFMRSGEQVIKSLNNSIVRWCDFLLSIETELICEVCLISLFINQQRSK